MPMGDPGRLRGIARSNSDLYSEERALLDDAANELEAARAVVEAAGVHVKNGGMRNAQKLADALAAYDKAVGRGGET